MPGWAFFFAATCGCKVKVWSFPTGLEAVGPTCNFSAYSDFSKFVLILDMLAGRLEIFPILALFSRSTWTGK